MCDEWEPVVEKSLLPWRRYGARIRREHVDSLETSANKVCWQRVRVINNRLFVEQPEVNKYPRRPGQEEDKWYTIVLVETLLAVLQLFSLPDVDLCISEEVPQVLKGENRPSFSMTITEAHMDILAPDFFFRSASASSANLNTRQSNLAPSYVV